MSLNKKDFYGKEVTDAIKKACEELEEAQENLDIEVIETGSTGIFGLIRKKAHIRVQVRSEIEEDSSDVLEADDISDASENEVTADQVRKGSGPSELVGDLPFESAEEPEEEAGIASAKGKETEAEVEVSPETLELIRTELLQIVELMGFPSTLDIETDGVAVSCTLRGEFEENLAGVDGKVLDSLQYILRKIVSRKVTERIRISLNVGDFRERRLEELKERAVSLAAQVKEDGKTQVLPALNPSERRAIHMILQEDKEIRSRSVGEGLFKKILIYKPGKGNRGGRRRSNSRGRQNKAGQNQKQNKGS